MHQPPCTRSGETAFKKNDAQACLAPCCQQLRQEVWKIHWMRRARRREGRGATVWLWLQTTLAHCPSDPPLQIAPLIQHTADVYVQLLANGCSVILNFTTSTYDKLNNHIVDYAHVGSYWKEMIDLDYRRLFHLFCQYSGGCNVVIEGEWEPNISRAGSLIECR